MEHLRDSELKKDLQASVRTAQELGPDYESEIIDGFLQRLDARLDAQVATRVQRELDRREGPVQFQKKNGDGGGGGRNPAIPILSIVLAVPLTAISAALTGLPGLFVVWIGIVLVNMAVAGGIAVGSRAERRRQRFGDPQDGRDRDGWG
jgi:hypothetical protein